VEVVEQAVGLLAVRAAEEQGLVAGARLLLELPQEAAAVQQVAFEVVWELQLEGQKPEHFVGARWVLLERMAFCIHGPH